MPSDGWEWVSVEHPFSDAQLTQVERRARVCARARVPRAAHSPWGRAYAGLRGPWGAPVVDDAGQGVDESFGPWIGCVPPV